MQPATLARAAHFPRDTAGLCSRSRKYCISIKRRFSCPSKYHKYSKDYEDVGYLTFTRSSLYKLTFPLEPPSSKVPLVPHEKSIKTGRNIYRSKLEYSNNDRDHFKKTSATESPPFKENLIREADYVPLSTERVYDPNNVHRNINPKKENIQSLLPSKVPTAIFMLHSEQPLSYLANLILTEQPRVNAVSGTVSQSQQQDSRADAHTSTSYEPPLSLVNITFHTRHRVNQHWSLATGLSDFFQHAARHGSFVIRISEGSSGGTGRSLSIKDKSDTEKNDTNTHKENSNNENRSNVKIREVRVQVPSFDERTRFLRAALRTKTNQVDAMVRLKAECDRLAHMDTQRMAFAGAGALATWWICVAFLTFGTNLGWEMMEPATYLVGLGSLMCGYVWFLIHNREVSYRAVLHETTSRRQQRLYAERGFSRERYEEIITEVRELRQTIKRIALDYGFEWNQHTTSSGAQAHRGLNVVRRCEEKDKNPRHNGSKDEQSSNEGDVNDRNDEGNSDKAVINDRTQNHPPQNSGSNVKTHGRKFKGSGGEGL